MKATEQQKYTLDKFKSYVQTHASKPHTKASQGLLGVVISQLDKDLGKEKRIAFLSWLFERTITTSKITDYGIGVVTDTTGLKHNESFALLMWAQPHKEGKVWKLGAPYLHYIKTIKAVFTEPLAERLCSNCGVVSENLNKTRHCPKCATMFAAQFEQVVDSPKPEQQTTTCRNCVYGLIEAGENFVTREMALDAGDETLQGISLGMGYDVCSCCGGDFNNCKNCKGAA